MSISVTRGSFRAGGRTPGREARHAQLPEGLGAEAGFFEQMVPEQEPADVGRDPGFGKVGQAQTVAAPAVNRDRSIGGCVASLGRAIGGFEEACEPLEKGRDQLQNPLRLFVVRDQQVVIDNRLDQLGDQCDARLLDYVARIVEGDRRSRGPAAVGLLAGEDFAQTLHEERVMAELFVQTQFAADGDGERNGVERVSSQAGAGHLVVDMAVGFVSEYCFIGKALPDGHSDLSQRSLAVQGGEDEPRRAGGIGIDDCRLL